MIKISKERLDRIILEETVDVIQEILEVAGSPQQVLDYLNHNLKAIDGNRQYFVKKTNENGNLINNLAKILMNLVDEIDVIKQQVPGLEKTAKLSNVEIPILPSSKDTKTIRRKIAENKIK